MSESGSRTFAEIRASCSATGTHPAEAPVRAGMCVAFDEDMQADDILDGLAACYRDTLFYFSAEERERLLAKHIASWHAAFADSEPSASPISRQSAADLHTAG